MKTLSAITAAAFMIVAAPQPAHGQECPAGDEIARLDRSLFRTGGRLASGAPLRIVALGSSSTKGAGATSDDKSYPSRLEAELRQRFLGANITVFNEGVGGETIYDMIARLETSVFSKRPHAVIFQVGTNTVLRDQSVEEAEVKIREAITMIQNRGIEVILMDAQFAPNVENKKGAEPMLRVLERASNHFGVSLFKRRDLMHSWHARSGIPVTAFITPDNIHMNDWGYDCLAKAIAKSIEHAALQYNVVMGPR